MEGKYLKTGAGVQQGNGFEWKNKQTDTKVSKSTCEGFQTSTEPREHNLAALHTGSREDMGQDILSGSCRRSLSQCFTKFNSVRSLSPVRLLATPWTAARQASLSMTNSQSLLKFTSTELVMPSSHLILCRPLLLLPSIPPSIRVFSNESALCIRWPKYWSFSFSISPSNEYSGLSSFRMDWLDLAVQGTLMSLLQHYRKLLLYT